MFTLSDFSGLKLGSCLDFYIDWNDKIYEQRDFALLEIEYIQRGGNEKFIVSTVEEYDRLGNRFSKVSNLAFFNETVNKNFNVAFDVDLKNKTVSMYVGLKNSLEKIRLCVVKDLSDDAFSLMYN